LPHRVDLRLQTAAGRKYTGRINAIIDKRKRRGLHMPSEMTARAGPLSGVPSERNYQAFYGALSASARGRDFLAEYARRNRKAHGEKLLAAIDKLQSLLPGTAAGQSETLKRELRSLLVEINAIQTELDASVLAIKAAKFTELAMLVEQRISNILSSLDRQPVPKADIPPISEPDDEVVEGSERAHLAVVPVPEQPELPIPTPAAPQPSPIALVRSEAIIEEVAFIEPRAKPIATNENYSPDSAAPSVDEPRTVSQDPGWLHQPIRFNPSRP
jgi:hypothetical protein